MANEILIFSCMQHLQYFWLNIAFIAVHSGAGFRGVWCILLLLLLFFCFFVVVVVFCFFIFISIFYQKNLVCKQCRPRSDAAFLGVCTICLGPKKYGFNCFCSIFKERRNLAEFYEEKNVHDK